LLCVHLNVIPPLFLLPFPLCAHNERCAIYYVISASHRILQPVTAQRSLRNQTNLFKHSCETVYLCYRMMRRGRVMSNDNCHTKGITEFSKKKKRQPCSGLCHFHLFPDVRSVCGV
jgi:hypothetical protein